MAECLIVELQVQDRPTHLIVDTGLPGILLYEERLRKRVPGYCALRATSTMWPWADACASQTGHSPDVLFGKTNRDVFVLLVPWPAPDMLPGIDGIVNAGRVHFDFARKTFSWEWKPLSKTTGAILYLISGVL
jgi:hypothetical protein